MYLDIETKLEALIDVAADLEKCLETVRALLPLVATSDTAQTLRDGTLAIDNALKQVQETIDNSEVIAEEVIEGQEDEAP